MPIEMIRIDDRFIHGQVMVGWCPVLKPDRLILCDDRIADDDFGRQIYTEAAGDYKVTISSVAGTTELIKNNVFENEKILILIESPKVATQLLELQLPFDKVNVGGMHHQPGKRLVANYIYVDDEDLKHFRTLVQHNIVLEGRDVPTCRPLDLTKTLGLN
jgi:mannose/fructose/N-acetylgalactosamine-specific phosphotransferase system component IIB